MPRAQYKSPSTPMPTGRTYYSSLSSGRSPKRVKTDQFIPESNNFNMVSQIDQPDFFRPDGTSYSTKKMYGSKLLDLGGRAVAYVARGQLKEIKHKRNVSKFGRKRANQMKKSY